MAENQTIIPFRIQIQFISDEVICYWCTFCQKEYFHSFTEEDMRREWYAFSCHACADSGKRVVNLGRFLDGINRRKKEEDRGVGQLEETEEEKGREV